MTTRTGVMPRLAGTRMPARGGAGGVARGAAAVLMRRPGLVLLTLAVLGGGGLFGWNALTQQTGKHPAPLFGKAVDVPPPMPPRRAEATPAPIPAPRPEIATASLQTASIDSMPAARPAPAGDTIGALIRASDGTARQGEPGKAAEGARVLTAQRALAKLGYGPIKADGIFGGTTRQALQRFEKDRNLPVTGELAPRTLKQLASASGIRVE